MFPIIEVIFINEDGIPLFSYDFRKLRPVDNILISGLISAIDHFARHTVGKDLEAINLHGSKILIGKGSKVTAIFTVIDDNQSIRKICNEVLEEFERRYGNILDHPITEVSLFDDFANDLPNFVALLLKPKVDANIFAQIVKLLDQFDYISIYERSLYYQLYSNSKISLDVTLEKYLSPDGIIMKLDQLTDVEVYKLIFSDNGYTFYVLARKNFLIIIADRKEHVKYPKKIIELERNLDNILKK